MWYLLQALLGYTLADAFGALFHLMNDRGIGIPYQVRDFQKHHETLEMTFDWQPMLLGFPIALLGLWCYPVFWCTLGAAICISQFTHYYTHYPAPAWVRFFQGWLILSPAQHAQHHNDYDRDFCVLAGWNNWWVNWVSKGVNYLWPPKK